MKFPLRFLDLALALALAPVWVPLFLLAAAIAWAGQGRPVFYRATRLGRGGHPFVMLKFRTMAQNADQVGPPVAARGDARITRAGRFLRATKLDEIPQFLHVLRGDMSMVGPRPEAPTFLSHYGEEGLRSLAVKPGVTGPAAIAFMFQAESDRADFHAYYVERLLPLKLKLNAACAEELTRFPIRTTLAMIGWTLIAVACKLAGLRPPSRIGQWIEGRFTAG
jgi:lipopolysaccharide/colanic/teichoic acid biosynthesis glycosyltransferase